MKLPNSVWLTVLLAAVVIIPRAAFISYSHNESIDDEYHLFRGVCYWTKHLPGVRLNDPPLGEALSALPMVLMGVRPEPTKSILYDQSHKPETLLMAVALWKALLFLPFVAVVFTWVRSVYGLTAAWLGVGIFAFEPNFAAHMSVGAIDVLGVEGIVITCWLAWRYFERPTWLRMMPAAMACGAAVLIKHTAIIVPGVIAGYGVLWWVVKPLWNRLFPPKTEPKAPWSGWTVLNRVAHIPTALVVALLALWAFTLFDYSYPTIPKGPARQNVLYKYIPGKMPAGVYVGSIFIGFSHAERGHAGYLFGEKGMLGWWYYFPVVATYKVPIPVLILMLMSMASLLVLKPRWSELGLLVPAVAWTAFIMNSTVNIGFRHFLPPYAFWLMLATRAAAVPIRTWIIPAFISLGLLAADCLWHCPNYISYFNFPRYKPYLAINDSNVDWGQGLKQVRRWIDKHPQTKPIYLHYFGRFESKNVPYYLGDRVRLLKMDSRPPKSGILIISPFWEAGVWDKADRYRVLRKVHPRGKIGDCMLIYDLDRIRAWKASIPPREPTTTTAPTAPPSLDAL